MKHIARIAIIAILALLPLGAAGQITFTDTAEINSDIRPAGVFDHRLRPAQGRLMFRQYRNASGTLYQKFDYMDTTGYKFATIRYAKLEKLSVSSPYHHRARLIGVMLTTTTDIAWLYIRWPFPGISGEVYFVIMDTAGKKKLERWSVVAEDALVTRPADAPQGL